MPVVILGNFNKGTAKITRQLTTDTHTGLQQLVPWLKEDVCGF